MRIALLDNERIEATPGLKALCPGCFQPVTSVCGERRIWHWRHISLVECDRWHEPETLWHRNWKDKFPLAWQECRLQDQSSGEWHIADLRTEHEVVVEFQHSPIDPQERVAREDFYKKMFWVVDGTRLKKDYPRILEDSKSGRWLKMQRGVFLVPNPDECFPLAWRESKVPVIFDFRGETEELSTEEMREVLLCLLPGRIDKHAVLIALIREGFIDGVTKNYLIPSLDQSYKAALSEYTEYLKMKERLSKPRRVYRPTSVSRTRRRF